MWLPVLLTMAAAGDMPTEQTSDLIVQLMAAFPPDADWSARRTDLDPASPAATAPTATATAGVTDATAGIAIGAAASSSSSTASDTDDGDTGSPSAAAVLSDGQPDDGMFDLEFDQLLPDMVTAVSVAGLVAAGTAAAAAAGGTAAVAGSLWALGSAAAGLLTGKAVADLMVNSDDKAVAAGGLREVDGTGATTAAADDDSGSSSSKDMGVGVAGAAITTAGDAATAAAPAAATALAGHVTVMGGRSKHIPAGGAAEGSDSSINDLPGLTAAGGAGTGNVEMLRGSLGSLMVDDPEVLLKRLATEAAHAPLEEVLMQVGVRT